MIRAATPRGGFCAKRRRPIDGSYTWTTCRRRLGPTGNFARLLCEAQRRGADVVLLADQDDIWHADKVARQITGHASRGHERCAHAEARFLRCGRDRCGRASAPPLVSAAQPPAVSTESPDGDAPGPQLRAGLRLRGESGAAWTLPCRCRSRSPRTTGGWRYARPRRARSFVSTFRCWTIDGTERTPVSGRSGMCSAAADCGGGGDAAGTTFCARSIRRRALRDRLREAEDCRRRGGRVARCLLPHPRRAEPLATRYGNYTSSACRRSAGSGIYFTISAS